MPRIRKLHMGLINTYKRKSVFTQTFLVFVGMFLLMVAMVYYFAMDLISDNIRQRTYDSNMNMLSKTSNALDMTFSSIGWTMNELLWDANITGLLISPDLLPNAQRESVTKKMSGLVRNNELILEVYLYLPKVDTVYTSSGKIEKLESFKDDAITDIFNGGIAATSRIVGDKFPTMLKVVNGRILMFQEFPTNEKNGTLIFELDNISMFNVINSPNEDSDKNIYVFSEQQYPIFDKQVEYPLEAKEGTFISYKSPTTGWLLVYPFDDRDVKLNFEEITLLILPFIIVFLLVSLIFSFYITRKIYKPINELMLSLMDSLKNNNEAMEKENDKNEFDLIKHAFTYAVDKSDHLAKLVENVRPVIKEKLIKNLLFEKETSPAYIEETLEIIGSPASINQRYVVLAIKLNAQNAGTPTDVEINLFNMSINKIISSLTQNKCDFDSVVTDDDSQIIILGFSNEISIARIKCFIITLCGDIKAAVCALPYSVVIGRGKICYSITDIKYSYADAKEDLNYKLYLGDEAVSDAVEAGGPEAYDAHYDSLYFNGQYKYIIQAVMDGNLEKAAAISERITKEIADNVNDPKTAYQLFETLINTMIEKMVSMMISSDEMVFVEKKSMEFNFDSFDDISRMRQFTIEFCDKSIELIDTYNRKKSNKYIERAKEFVVENYADSSLSLSTVGKHIGINPAYLSRLFYENLNQRFVDYINQYRVDKSKQLLDITNLTIKEVGFKTGFNSIQYFIRVFKKHTGLTPGQYRDQCCKCHK